MRKYLKFPTAFLFWICIPLISLPASASVYRLEYSGTITPYLMQGNGMGFSVGDHVAGNMEFDMSKATDDLVWGNYAANYRAISGSDFVTSTITPDIGNIPGHQDNNWDQIYIYNGSLDTGFESDRSIFGVSNVYNVYNDQHPWHSFGMSIFVTVNNSNWLDGTNIPEFEFTSSSPYFDFTESRGDLFDVTVFNPVGQPPSAENNTTSFQLDFVKLIRLPEPNPLLLILIGLASLMYRRKLDVSS